MKRSLWVCALLLAGAGALAAQQASQNQYQGTSDPPPDDTITTPMPQTPPAKPAPGRPLAAATAVPGSSTEQDQASVPSQPPSADSSLTTPASTQTDGTDDGIVMLAPDNGSAPALMHRDAASDPDGDIVHPAPPPPGTLGYGTTIRARLLDRLSTVYSEQGDSFRATVASDVMQNGQILIPAGSEIDGAVEHVSTGHLAGHGSMLLRPEMVILPDGSKFHLYAQVTAAPGSNTRVGAEGQITPGSRVKKDSVEYGGGVGAGAVTGAVVAGPAGALAGTVVGAGAVTVHLLMDHPQATLPKGTVLDFGLTQPLHLESENAPRPVAAPPVADGSTTQIP